MSTLHPILTCDGFGRTAKQAFSLAAYTAFEEATQAANRYSRWTKIGTVVAAPFAYVVLIPLALIEAIVRGVFALLAIGIGLCLPEGETRDWYQEHIFTPLAGGALKSFATFFASTGMTVASICDIVKYIFSLVGWVGYSSGITLSRLSTGVIGNFIEEVKDHHVPGAIKMPNLCCCNKKAKETKDNNPDPSPPPSSFPPLPELLLSSTNEV